MPCLVLPKGDDQKIMAVPWLEPGFFVVHGHLGVNIQKTIENHHF